MESNVAWADEPEEVPEWLATPVDEIKDNKLTKKVKKMVDKQAKDRVKKDKNMTIKKTVKAEKPIDEPIKVKPKIEEVKKEVTVTQPKIEVEVKPKIEEPKKKEFRFGEAAYW